VRTLGNPRPASRDATLVRKLRRGSAGPTKAVYLDETENGKPIEHVEANGRHKGKGVQESFEWQGALEDSAHPRS
jgi:hypothetical protein